MTVQRGLPEGSRVGECPSCDESAYMWLVQLGPNRVLCEHCGGIFDPQTGAIEPASATKDCTYDDDDE